MKISAYKGTVSVDENSIQSLLLKESMAEVTRFTSDDDQYRRIGLFIFLLCDLSNGNPLVDRPFDSKKDDALIVAFSGIKEAADFKIYLEAATALKDAINSAISTYVEYENTDEQRDINTYNTKMDQFRYMLKGMQPTIIRNENEKTGFKTFSTNIDIINSVLNDVVSLIQAKASMIALYTTGTVPKHLRGGLSQLAKGNIDTHMPATPEQLDDIDE